MDKTDIGKKVDEILANRKNSTYISELLDQLQQDGTMQDVYIQELERLFLSLRTRKEFHVDPLLKVTNYEEWELEVKYVKWLQDTYETMLSLLYKLLDSNQRLENDILKTLMNLLASEALYPLETGDEQKPAKSSFPDFRLESVIKIIISTRSKKTSLISCFESYLKYVDVFHYTWKILRKLLSQCQESNDTFLFNVLELVERMPLPKPNKNADASCGRETFCKFEGIQNFMNICHVRKIMSKVWQNLVNRNISMTMHRKLMVILLEKFLNDLEKPIYLTDFFMGSINMGNANGLLAMQGILTLVQKHNIEYPNIYGKLYSMFETNILLTKYKSRLFYLADIFLSSTYLPENLIASFAKRVARLSLSAQISDVLICIKFIENILIRHPGLKKLIHHPEGGKVEEDPFLAEENDPMKTRAIESSLWELSLLKNHIQPSVSSAACFIDKNLPQIEVDVREALDVDNEQLFEAESEKKVKGCLNISRPQKIVQLMDDRVYKMWELI